MPDKRRPPSWACGIAVAELIYLAILGAAWLLEWLEDGLPSSFPQSLDAIQSILFLAAFPVGGLGWAFVWGDNGPPYAFMETSVFSLASSVAIYGVVGLCVGTTIGLFHPRSDPR